MTLFSKNATAERISDKVPVIENIATGLQEIENIGNEICNTRKKALLLMFYSDECGRIDEGDINHLEDILDNVKKISDLDLIIHTRGGDVSTSYYLAQLIRTKCDRINLIVPTHAYSGGTAIALSADIIEMSSTSKLSPIDVQVENKERQLAILNFDKYIEFISDAAKQFDLDDEKNRATIISNIMIELCKTIHPFDVGQLYRLKSLHEIYAKQLLLNYMFKHDSNKLQKAENTIKYLTSGSPSHDFDIDINLARDFGLNVKELDEKTYKLSKGLIRTCIEKKREGIICPFIGQEHNFRVPFFKLFIPQI